MQMEMESRMAEKKIEKDGYEISWQDPPLTAMGYDINVASNDQALQKKLEVANNKPGAYVISHVKSLDEGLTLARAFIAKILE
jgi:hypothetical protein